MAGLFRKDPSFKGGKFLVQRRDGTVPDWPWFVLGARDPAAPAALLAYAEAALKYGMDPQYVSDIKELAAQFDEYRIEVGPGDPDAPRHRKDDPRIIELLAGSKGA